jgi:acyl carrier protein
MSDLKKDASKLNQLTARLQDPEAILKALDSEKREPRPELSTAYVAPRTPEERTVAEIWARLLGVERVGVNDDFFELGGHSMVAMQLISRLRDDFQVELPVKVLFTTSAFTVAELVRVIDQYCIQEADESAMLKLMDEIDSLSDEEVQALLAEEDQ